MYNDRNASFKVTGYILRGITLPITSFFLSEWGSALKGKNLCGANSFLKEQTPVWKGFDVQSSKQEVTKFVSLGKNGQKKKKKKKMAQKHESVPKQLMARNANFKMILFVNFIAFQLL